MHVALLTNTAWIDEELAILKHLIVGLIDERVRVTQVVPESIRESEFTPFVKHVKWNEVRTKSRLISRMLNRLHISQITPSLKPMGLDLIHALDGRMWHGAAYIARKLDLPLVLSASSFFDLETARSIRGRVDSERTVITAATLPLSAAIERAVHNKIPVQLVPTGIYRATQHEHHDPVGTSPSAIISGTGRLDSNYQALLQGIAEVVRIHPNIQFFFDGQGVDQHNIWQVAERLNLLPNISIIPRQVGHREILLRADILIHPQPLGRARSITLQAMARKIPILAHEDPWLDYLIPDQTAWVVAGDSISSQTWRNLLLRVIEQPKAVHTLGESSRNWVTTHRLASQQITRLAAIYRMLAPQTQNIKFPA
ncbi:glycosyltransferase family 4 protein [Planctomycetota bacterium]|nr:glycosyltransferase family 4 protein [Planctomycetota bacterium]